MLLEQLNVIDNRKKDTHDNTSKLTLEEQQKLTTIVNKNIGMIKNLISTILHKLYKQNVTDIVMENLTLFDTNSSYVKNKQTRQKYTRLVRMLHLSKVKDWFKRNAENYGIRVHFIDAAYTSQECSHCHTILKSNRNGNSYSCPCCGHTTHSDYNASDSILTRFTEDVLLKKLCHIMDTDDSMRYIPKHISHKHIKGIITNHYYPNS